MRRRMIMMFGALLAVAISAQAAVNIEVNSNANGETRVWTVADVNLSTPTVSGDSTPVLTGFLEAPVAATNAEIKLTFTAASDWHSATASNNMVASSFDTYLAGLTPAIIDGAVYAFGIDSRPAADPYSNRMNGPGEVLFIKMETANITETINLNSFGFALNGATDLADILIYHPADNTVTEIQWDTSINSVPEGPWEIASGDIMIVAVGASMGTATVDNFRWDSITFDIPSTATGVIAPGGFTATAANREIQLDWVASPAPNFASYNVYRSQEQGTGYAPIAGAQNITTNTYTDTAVTNSGTYYYVATTVDTDSFESGYSAEAFATPFVTVPINLVVANADGEVALSWDVSTDLWLGSYNVYRRLDGETNGYSQVNNVGTNTFFVDTGLVNEELYVYAVSMVSSLGADESDLSVEVIGVPTDDFVLVNLVDNEQRDLRSYPTGTNELYTMIGQGTINGNARIGAYVFDQLSRPAVGFPLSLDTLAGEGKTTNDIASVSLRIYVFDNALREKIDISYEPYDPPFTNVVPFVTNDLGEISTDVTNVLYFTTNILDIVTNGPGSAVEVYASVTNHLNTWIDQSMFENADFTLVTEVADLTNGAPGETWVSIDVTDAVMADLINDNQTNGTAGSMFRFNIKDDDQLGTNDHFSVKYSENDQNDFGTAYVPQLRFHWNVGTAFDMWATGWGAPEVGQGDQDYDGDGANNMLEYGLGGDPVNPAIQGATLPTLTQTGGGLEYVHPVRSDDNTITYTVETRTNLLTGSWTTAGVSPGGTLVDVTNTIDMVEDAKFIRLKVEQN